MVAGLVMPEFSCIFLILFCDGYCDVTVAVAVFAVAFSVTSKDFRCRLKLDQIRCLKSQGAKRQFFFSVVKATPSCVGLDECKVPALYACHGRYMCIIVWFSERFALSL